MERKWNHLFHFLFHVHKKRVKILDLLMQKICIHRNSTTLTQCQPSNHLPQLLCAMDSSILWNSSEINSVCIRVLNVLELYGPSIQVGNLLTKLTLAWDSERANAHELPLCVSQFATNTKILNQVWLLYLKIN